MSQKVSLIKTISGEYYIGYKIEESDSNITLGDVRSLVPQMTSRGMSLAAAPIVPFAITSPKNLTIQKNFIIADIDEDNINDSIVKGYKSDISGLDLTTASTPQIIT